MLKILADILYKINLKLNKVRFSSNSNVKIGRNFKLGNNTTFIIHPTSNALLGNSINIRNNLNLVLGKKSKLIIEDNVFMNNGCSINCLESISIGENTLFGENVKLYDHNHKYDDTQVFHKEFSTSSIRIGKNCWLGSNVVILKGVTIGDNVIIGAGCVIHNNIQSNTIVVNIQERLIKQNL